MFWTQNVSEGNQKHFLCLGHKFFVRNIVARASKQGNIFVRNDVFATSCPCRPPPLWVVTVLQWNPVNTSTEGFILTYHFGLRVFPHFSGLLSARPSEGGKKITLHEDTLRAVIAGIPRPYASCLLVQGDNRARTARVLDRSTEHEKNDRLMSLYAGTTTYNNLFLAHYIKKKISMLLQNRNLQV